MRLHLKQLRFLPLVLLMTGFFSAPAAASSSEGGSETYNATEVTMHHLTDNYKLEIYETSDGHHVGLDLPRILYNPIEGSLDFYGSTHAAEADGYVMKDQYIEDAHHGEFLVPQAREEMKRIGQQLETASGKEKEQLLEQKAQLASRYGVTDFSITQNVFFMLLTAVLLILMFGSMARYYNQDPNRPPKGLAAFLEPVVVFIRDEVAKPNIPHYYMKFTPLLLTFFFFILILNLFGITPTGPNITGNISVTLSLALVTLVATNIFATKSYWMHIFWFPGVPIALKPLMFVVEFIGIFTKPFALTVRLFANITAGHVIILSLLGLIFVMGKMGSNPVAGYGVSIISVAFALFIDCLELLVAFLQAYVFTLLSAVFIGQAAEEAH
jgi:F-type H+-transporting ATPase subunit a